MGNDDSAIARRRADAAKNADYQRKRQTLARVAAELFHAHGLGDTSLADVAREAGLDRASVYYYFANKEELFAAVLRESLAEVCEETMRIAEKATPPADRLRELIETQMATYDRHYPYLFAYAREDFETLDISPGLKDEVVAVSTQITGAWERVVSEGIADGVFDSELSSGILAYTILGAVAWSHRWYKPGRSLGPEALGRGLAQLLVDGLRVRADPHGLVE